MSNIIFWKQLASSIVIHCPVNFCSKMPQINYWRDASNLTHFHIRTIAWENQTLSQARVPFHLNARVGRASSDKLLSVHRVCSFALYRGRFWPRTRGNVFLRFCIVSSNELVVLDSLENRVNNTKTQGNVSVCTFSFVVLGVIYLIAPDNNSKTVN